MESCLKIACTSPPGMKSGILPGIEPTESEGVSNFEDLFRRKIRTPQDDLAGTALIGVMGTSSLASSPVEMVISRTMNSERVMSEISGISAEAGNNGQVVSFSGLPPTQVKFGKWIEAMNTQPGLMEQMTPEQVSTDPTGNVGPYQTAVIETLEEQKLAVNKMVFSEGEIPEGQLEGAILKSLDGYSREPVQTGESRFVSEPNHTVQPARNSQEVAEGLASMLNQSGDIHDNQQVKAGHAVKFTKEVMPNEKEPVPVKGSLGEKSIVQETKFTVSQESVMSVMQVHGGTTEVITSSGKQLVPQVALAQQLAAGMDLMVRQGRSTMHIQLSPQELGTISIHLVSSSQGVTVTMTADHQSTGQMLQNQVDDLRQALNSAGVQIADLNINQHQLSGQTNQFYGSFEHPRHERENQPHAHENDETQGITGVRLIGGGMVDYKI